ncbi:DoxX family protein [Hydrogenophaga luteola]|uniref:DoxX family protein n=1 Tax=Hydrogenophaga luteola TaxID=1591122 RepID=A0ABV7VZE9_9BURK
MMLAEKSLYALGVALSLVVAVLAIQFVLTAPVTSWFMASALFWIVAMLAALAFSKKHGLFAIIGSLFATMVVGRLFGTLRMGGGENTTNDPLLLAETGPGVPSVMWVSTLLAAVLTLWIVNYIRTHRSETPWGPVTDESWGLFFIRNYVGMMFIAHFSGHIFAGPAQFAIFEGYFASIGLKPAAAMVVLAGVSEVVAGIGLCLGLHTRLAALVGAVFLYLSMLWGNHFPVGYIWILPSGGWEFGIFWSVMVASFVLLGGGTISIDRLRFLNKRSSLQET